MLCLESHHWSDKKVKRLSPTAMDFGIRREWFTPWSVPRMPSIDRRCKSPVENAVRTNQESVD